MDDVQADGNAALSELRRRLNDGLAQARLTKTQLAARTRLGRTTVSGAFQSGNPVPSAQTVAALARVLKLPEGELLKLRRDAAGGPGEDGGRSGPGRPIGQWDPYALEVHPADTAHESPGGVERQVLPSYVEREHDRVLAEAVRDAAAGRSRMLVLVGESSTGKTRACWEAVQPLAEQGWLLWHPFDPTRAEAALEKLHRVGPRTVVWLNEAQHYLGDPRVGERIAAAVHALLVHRERGPLLVLGTLWPDYLARYTAFPVAGAPDGHSRVRELLAGRTVNVPVAFDQGSLAKATALAEHGDRLLADALTRARADGRLAQDLAGAPALLERYHTASPAARALLEAAMDARRLGIGLHLPQAFLTDAAPAYLHDTDWDQLTDDWAEQAYAELVKPVHGKQAPLRRVTPRPHRRLPGPAPELAANPSPHTAGPVFRLADYLEQHGHTSRRHLCPPASFWHAAHTHITHPHDLYFLSLAAEDRHRLQWAHLLFYRAADHGSSYALIDLLPLLVKTGDIEGAQALTRQITDSPATASLIARRNEAEDEEAKDLARQEADNGDAAAQLRLAERKRDEAETLLLEAVDDSSPSVELRLAALERERAEDREGAEALARQAAARGYTGVLLHLAGVREEAGDREGAEALYRQAADHGYNNRVTGGLPRRDPLGRAFKRLWPYGLDPDGTPTPQWQDGGLWSEA
ncbi:hypothetical protein ACWCQ0_43415 [Streptomyces massasporeus]|uniref:HTH cro/C1-type domain-containing protein n=1 Tax=Streptomyces massasporeus TaxID=67324 RepID=A0ABW6LSM4_9ACTN